MKNSIKFYVAECMEFEVLGDVYEDINTVGKAVQIYNSIPAERLNGIKGIGIDDSEMGHIGLVYNGRMDTDILECMPSVKKNKDVQEAIGELQKYFI